MHIVQVMKLLQHMELKYERKINEMEAKLSLRYNGRIDALKSEFNRRLTEMEETYDRKDDERTAEIQSCKKKLRSYKNKVDTLEEKVEVLEKQMQIGDKKRKKRKILSPLVDTFISSNFGGELGASLGYPINNILYIGLSILEQKVVQFISKRGGGERYRQGVHINEIIQHFSSQGVTRDDIEVAIHKLTNILYYDDLPHYGNIGSIGDGQHYQYSGSSQCDISDGALYDAILYVIKTLGGKLYRFIWLYLSFDVPHHMFRPFR